MQHLEVSGAIRPLKWSLGVKWLIKCLETRNWRINSLSSYENVNLKIWWRRNCCYILSPLCSFLYLFSVWSLTFWLSVLECLPFVKKTGILQESPSEKYRFEQGNTCVQLLTASQKREFKPCMEMRCVRPRTIV